MAYTDAGRISLKPRRKGVVTTVKHAFHIWRQRRVLSRLDDRALMDLGLTHEDIARETDRPIWDVPNTWLK